MSDDLKDYVVELKFTFKVNTKKIPWWLIKELVATIESEVTTFNRDTLTSSNVLLDNIESNVGDYEEAEARKEEYE